MKCLHRQLALCGVAFWGSEAADQRQKDIDAVLFRVFVFNASHVVTATFTLVTCFPGIVQPYARWR